jgi:hypothetical protein
LLSFAAYQSSSVTVSPTATWTPTSLSVREGEFYRLTATGSCTDEAGQAYGPAGTDSGEQGGLVGPPTDMTDSTSEKTVSSGHSRLMLLARIRDSRILIPVGLGITFVAPWTGELSFRANIDPESPESFVGDFRVTLERTLRPPLVDGEGKTTISTPVCKTKYLVFEPEGIRWRYLNFMSATEEPMYPTLINGIAWWPLPDKPNVEGLRELTQTSRSPLLKTRAFSWAAGPGLAKVKPVVVAGTVTAEGPTPDVPALKFSSSGGTSEVRCTFTKPTSK